jgi:CRP-like cAMP-binding protein
MKNSGYLSDNKELIEKFRSLPLFRDFPANRFNEILEMSKIMEFEPSEEIIKEGQYDNWIYFLLSGKVGICKQGESISILNRRGDLFGEMGIIDGSPRSASIMAIEKTSCLAVDISFMDRLKGESRLAFTGLLYQLFSEILAVRLRIADEELVKAREEISFLKGELKKNIIHC